MKFTRMDPQYYSKNIFAFNYGEYKTGQGLAAYYDYDLPSRNKWSWGIMMSHNELTKNNLLPPIKYDEIPSQALHSLIVDLFTLPKIKFNPAQDPVHSKFEWS